LNRSGLLKGMPGGYAVSPRRSLLQKSSTFTAFWSLVWHVQSLWLTCVISPCVQTSEARQESSILKDIVIFIQIQRGKGAILDIAEPNIMEFLGDVRAKGCRRCERPV